MKKMIRLTVENTQSVNYVQAPVSSGIPIPAEYQLQHVDVIELLDKDGHVVQAQFLPLAFYPDGSTIKWLLVSFLADVTAGNERNYALVIDREERHSQEIEQLSIAKEQADGFHIHTGRLQCKIRTDRDFLTDISYRSDDGVWMSRSMNALFSLRIGEDDYIAEAPEDIMLEDNGPVRALLRISGYYISRDNDRSSDVRYVLRIEAWHGRPELRLTLTVINEGTDIAIHDLSLDWNSRDTQSLKICRNDGYQQLLQPEEAGWGIVSESYERSRVGKLNDSDVREYIGSTEWWASMEFNELSLVTTIREFHERYPKSLEVTRSGGLKVGLLPESSAIKDSFLPGNQLLDSYRFREGEARTYELLIGCWAAEADADVIQREMMAYHRPLLALAPWSWYADSRALGDIAPRSAKYAEFEQAVDESLALYLGRRERGKLYGDRNYGDDEYGRPGTWNNGEYDYTHVGMLHFLRGAGRDWYEKFARPYARHLMDIDSCHAGSGAGKIYAHCERHNSDAPKLGSHAWLRGLIEYYCFSGDMRAKEVAMHVADTWSSSILRGEGLEGTERGITWPIISMLGMYQVIPEERYMRAAEVLIDIVVDCHDPEEGHFVGTMFRETTKDYWGTFVIGSPVLESLIMYEQLTGDEKIREIVVRAAKRLARLNWLDDVGEWEYTHSMLKGERRVHNAKTNKMVTPAVLHAYLYSGDEELLDRSLQAFNNSVRTPSNHGKDLGQSYCFGIRIPALLDRCLQMREERRQRSN